MKINILLCDTFPGLLPEYIPSYPSMFINLFNKVDPKTEYCVYNAFENEFPKKVTRDELYLVTGSNAGVYENIDWIKNLLAFMRQAHAAEIPLVGICFGHQAIAQALGGKVVKSGKGWGTGIRQSEIIHEKAFSYFNSGKMSLHYNHHDQVIKLPTEAVLFATSDFCENEGFIIGNHILTFQGHPEYTKEYNEHLILNHAKAEPEEVKKAASESIQALPDMSMEAARWILALTQ